MSSVLNRIINPTARFAACGAATVAASSATIGIIQLTHENSGESTTIGFVEHFAAALLSLLLLAVVPLVMYLGRRTGAVRAGTVAGAGAVALAALALSSNIMGEDAAFFAAIAIPANLAILGGWIGLAAAAVRSGRVPRALAIGLPLSLIVMIPLSQLGGGILAGVYFLALASWVLRVDRPQLAASGMAPAAA